MKTKKRRGMQGIARFWRDESGATAVEFGFIAISICWTVVLKMRRAAFAPARRRKAA